MERNEYMKYGRAYLEEIEEKTSTIHLVRQTKAKEQLLERK